MMIMKEKNLIAIGFFIIASILLSWPLIINLNGHLLTTNYQDISHSDATINIDRLDNFKGLYLNNSNFLILKNHDKKYTVQNYDIPFFYYIPGVLISSIFNMSSIMYHNLFFIICLLLSGLFMYIFLFDATKQFLPSILGGFIYISSNYMLQEYVWGNIDYFPIQWLPLIFYFLNQIKKQSEFKYQLLFGVVLSLQVFTSAYATIYLSFLLPLYLFFQFMISNDKRIISFNYIKRLISSLLIALFMSVFYLIQRGKAFDPIRPIHELLSNSWGFSGPNTILGYLNIESNIYIGHIQLFLILIGLFALLIFPNKNILKKYLVYLVLSLIIALCIMGPFHTLSPYYILYKYWPLINKLRVPSRLFPFLLVCTSYLVTLPFLYLNKYKFYKKYKYLIFIILILSIISLQIQHSSWLSNHWIYYPQ